MIRRDRAHRFLLLLPACPLPIVPEARQPAEAAPPSRWPSSSRCGVSIANSGRVCRFLSMLPSFANAGRFKKGIDDCAKVRKSCTGKSRPVAHCKVRRLGKRHPFRDRKRVPIRWPHNQHCTTTTACQATNLRNLFSRVRMKPVVDRHALGAKAGILSPSSTISTMDTTIYRPSSPAS